MKDQEKARIKNLISEGKIQIAIKAMLSSELGESKKRSALSISSRYQKLKEQSNLGVLSFEQINIAENQITVDLIDLINSPDDEKLLIDNGISFTKNNRSKLWKYVAAFAASAFVLIMMLEAFNLTHIFSTIKTGEKMQLTVFVSDTKGNVVLENDGRLNIPLGNRSLNEVIGANGRTNFADITADNKGDTIQIGLDAEGWEIANDNNIFVFTGEPIRLMVKKDDSLGAIKGQVKTRDGQEFIGGAKVFINTDTTIFTDINGIFKIVLPEKWRVEKVTDSYLLTVSKQGYKTKTQYYNPNSSDAEIRLEK